MSHMVRSQTYCNLIHSLFLFVVQLCKLHLQSDYLIFMVDKLLLLINFFCLFAFVKSSVLESTSIQFREVIQIIHNLIIQYAFLLYINCLICHRYTKALISHRNNNDIQSNIKDAYPCWKSRCQIVN